jgi:hypothetical protein
LLNSLTTIANERGPEVAAHPAPRSGLIVDTEGAD